MSAHDILNRSRDPRNPVRLSLRPGRLNDHRSPTKGSRIALDRTLARTFATCIHAGSGNAGSRRTHADGTHAQDGSGRIQHRDDSLLSRRSAALKHLAQSTRHHHKLGSAHCRCNVIVCIQLAKQSTFRHSHQFNSGSNFFVDGSAPLSLLRDLVEPRARY